MNAVKKYFLERHNQSPKVRALEGERHTLNYEDTEQIGVLFLTRNEKMFRFINRFYEKIKADGKSFDALTFDYDIRQSPYIFPYSFFKVQDISLFGKIKSSVVEEFISKEFDYLYCVTVEPDIDMFDQILARSKAKCRVGNYREDKSDLYEMMIRLNEDEDIDKLIAQMLKRTEAIRYN